MVPTEQREEEGLRTVGSEGSDTRPITKMSQHHFAASLRAGIGPHNTILKRLFRCKERFYTNLLFIQINLITLYFTLAPSLGRNQQYVSS